MAAGKTTHAAVVVVGGVVSPVNPEKKTLFATSLSLSSPLFPELKMLMFSHSSRPPLS